MGAWGRVRWNPAHAPARTLGLPNPPAVSRQLGLPCPQDSQVQSRLGALWPDGSGAPGVSRLPSPQGPSPGSAGGPPGGPVLSRRGTGRCPLRAALTRLRRRPGDARPHPRPLNKVEVQTPSPQLPGRPVPSRRRPQGDRAQPSSARAARRPAAPAASRHRCTAPLSPSGGLAGNAGWHRDGAGRGSRRGRPPPPARPVEGAGSRGSEWTRRGVVPESPPFGWQAGWWKEEGTVAGAGRVSLQAGGHGRSRKPGARDQGYRYSVAPDFFRGWSVVGVSGAGHLGPERRRGPQSQREDLP